MRPKPAHLGPIYGAQFHDETVARAYHTRPPYPPELFDVLERLLPPGPRAMLDLGCGTGDLALGMSDRVDRVDAIDPSAAMLRVARARTGADRPGLGWIETRAEAFRPEHRYALIVAGESLHWMAWQDVFAWMPQALLPGAFLAIVTGREFLGVPWASELARLIPLYSTNQEFRPYDLVVELTSRGLFEEVGRAATAAVPFEQPADDYIESVHTRNGFSRERMTPQAAMEFDTALGRAIAIHSPDGIVRGDVRAAVVWGRLPVAESR